MRWGVSTAAAVLVALTGYLALDVADVAPGILTRAPAPRPSAAPASEPTAPENATVPPPLAPLDASAPVPTTQGLAAAVAGPLRDPALGSTVGLDIRDGITGASLLAVDAEQPRVPASTAKLLTAAAVAHAADLDARLPTRTVLVDGAVVLVAGGDTLLAPGAGDPARTAGHAGLDDLAAATSAALTAHGASAVRVVLDDSFARGAAVAPGWGSGDLGGGFTGPVTMLGMTTHRAYPGRPSPADPALRTASEFAAALGRHGVQVTGSLERGTARQDSGALELAAVESAPLRDVLALALLESDNALTEIVARRAAVEAGVAPTFPAVAGWIGQQLSALGVPPTGVTLSDASGLSRGTTVPTRTVADVVSLAASGREPDLAGVFEQLPVAGLTGTLRDRYLTGPQQSAAGLARAKTGTLTGVGSLGGTVVDADGRLLVYAVIADQVPPQGTLEARAALDRLVAAIAECGCQTPTRGTP